MSALLCTLALLVLAWLAHLAWWRVRLPRNHSAALLAVFLLVPAVALALWLAGELPLPVSVADLPGMTALYLGATGCYLITYAGVEHTSPSLVVVRTLKAAGARGCARADLAGLVTEESFVRPRLEALRRDGMVAPAPGGYVLTPRGRRAARIASAVAHAFRIPEGS